MRRHARRFALALAFACAAPRAAQAQASEERAQDFDEAALFLDPSSVVWVLDDGVGTDDAPWQDADPERSYLPFGQVHAGAHVRIAALPGGSDPLQGDGPLLELGGFLDIRYGRYSPWRLRLAVAVSYQPNESRYLGAGTTQASSSGALRFRAQPIAFDIGQWIVVRAGCDLGLQWSPSDPVGGVRTDLFGALTGDVV